MAVKFEDLSFPVQAATIIVKLRYWTDVSKDYRGPNVLEKLRKWEERADWFVNHYNLHIPLPNQIKNVPTQESGSTGE